MMGYWKIQDKISKAVKKNASHEPLQTALQIEKMMEKDDYEENVEYLTRMNHRALQANLMNYMIMPAVAVMALKTETKTGMKRIRKEAEDMIKSVMDGYSLKQMMKEAEETEAKKERLDFNIEEDMPDENSVETAERISEMINWTDTSSRVDEAIAYLTRNSKVKKNFWKYIKKMIVNIGTTEERLTDERNRNTVYMARVMKDSMSKKQNF